MSNEENMNQTNESEMNDDTPANGNVAGILTLFCIILITLLLIVFVLVPMISYGNSSSNHGAAEVMESSEANPYVKQFFGQ